MEDKEALNSLHSLLVEALLEKIRSGTATAADLGVARQFLKDNGIDVAAKNAGPMLRLHEALPFDPAQDPEVPNERFG